MRAFVLGSGSSGNALLVESRGTRVLVDAGVGPKVLAARLEALGVTLGPGDLAAIVATHHHGDHFAEITRLARAYAAPVYLHRGIDAPEVRRQLDVRDYDLERPLRIGELCVDTTRVPHDAPQVAMRVTDGVAALGVATDVGRVTPELVGLLAECDAALVEANHCTEMLAFGPYPDRVKRRIGGGLGHLSNAQAAQLAARLVGSRLSCLWLGHLSRENNTRERAKEVVAGAAPRLDVEVLPDDGVAALDVGPGRPHQLALAF